MKTCLIVDDMLFDRALLRNYMTRLGFKASEAASGEEALAACRQAMPDCLLLDWEMKGITGIEVLQRLRAMENGDRAFVVLCTSHDRPSHIGHAHAQGANAFIAKPVTVELLKERLQESGLLG